MERVAHATGEIMAINTKDVRNRKTKGGDGVKVNGETTVRSKCLCSRALHGRQLPQVCTCKNMLQFVINIQISPILQSFPVSNEQVMRKVDNHS